MACGRMKLDKRLRRKEPGFGGRMIKTGKGHNLGSVTEAEALWIQRSLVLPDDQQVEFHYRADVVDVDLLMRMVKS